MTNRRLLFLAITVVLFALSACATPAISTEVVKSDLADTSKYCQLVGTVDVQSQFIGVDCFGTKLGGNIYDNIFTARGISYQCAGTNEEMVCKVPIDVAIQATNVALIASPVPTFQPIPTYITNCDIKIGTGWITSSDNKILIEYVRNIGFPLKSYTVEKSIVLSHTDNVGNIFNIQTVCSVKYPSLNNFA